MLKLMIVDDEAIIRKGLRYYIDWDAYGIQVVAEASNGQQALEIAKTQHPDIVVTDIRMPVMDGIDMAHQLRRLQPDTRIIILTGYNENEYLHSAIKFGAVDFVLKNANPADIVEAVLNCKEKILLQQNQQHESDSNLLERNYQLFHSDLMRALLTGNRSEQEIREMASQLEIRFPGPRYLALFMEYDPANSPNLESVLMQLTFQLQQYHPFISQNNLVINGILNVESTTSIMPQLEKTLLHLRDNGIAAAKMLLAEPVNNLTQLARQGEKLCRWLPSLCWSKPYSVTDITQFPELPSLSLDIMIKLENELILAFASGDYVDFREKIQQFFDVSRINRVPLETLRESLERIITSLYNASRTYEDSYQSLKRLNSAKTVDDLFQVMKEQVEDAPNYSAQTHIVKTAKEYIEKNFDKSISLSAVAASIYVTPSYLSRIFKREMHISPLKYIHYCRIERAKELLVSTDLLVSDIALKIGYSEYKKFSFYFLRYVNMTPSEYRAQKRRG